MPIDVWKSKGFQENAWLRPSGQICDGGGLSLRCAFLIIARSWFVLPEIISWPKAGDHYEKVKRHPL